MTGKKTCSSRTDELRRLAETAALAKIAGMPEGMGALSVEEAQRVFRELRVHQIELEMQNDELRRARVELELASARYFDLYDLAPVGYITLNNHGLILESNLTAAKLLGVTRKDLIKCPLVSFIFPHDIDIYYANREQIFKTGTPQVFELRLTKSGGTSFWARLEAAKALGADGVPVCRAVVSDISDRKAAEAQLRATTAQMQLVLETTAEGIVGIDDEDRVVFVNPAAAAILKLPAADDVLGAKSANVLGHRLSSNCSCLEGVCPIRETLANQEVQRVADEFFTRGDGVVIPVEYVVAPLVSHGVTIGAVIAFHDITDRKALESELRRANEDLEQFAYVASHDLRQPLRVVSGYIKLIEKEMSGKLSPELKEFFGFVVDGAMRMDRMILDLLDYARTGRDVVAFEPIPLVDVIRESLLNLQLLIEESETEVVIADDMPTVRGIGMELVRLFQNLIGNAIQYRAPDRESRVEIGYREDRREWVIWVRDNGIGISPSDHARAFAIFQRLVSGATCSGTGIGLAVCKKITEHHGGRIWIESEVGEGSCLFVAFPKLKI